MNDELEKLKAENKTLRADVEKLLNAHNLAISNRDYWESKTDQAEAELDTVKQERDALKAENEKLKNDLTIYGDYYDMKARAEEAERELKDVMEMVTALEAHVACQNIFAEKWHKWQSERRNHDNPSKKEAEIDSPECKETPTSNTGI
jgi:chromosome segregation ATPase